MTKINGGATLWARQTIDSKVFCDKPHVWFKIWFYLINKVNHKDNKQFKRGSCFLKYEWIMQKTKATKSELDHAMRWFRFGKMVATQKATGGFTVEVLNYNTFQNLESYKSDSKSDTKATEKRQRSDREAIPYNKNDKNDKNVKNEKNVKDKYMDVVFLTKIEYEKLIKELGEPLAKEYIKDLSLYIQSKGKKYKSHYATILTWHRKNKKTEPVGTLEERMGGINDG